MRRVRDPPAAAWCHHPAGGDPSAAATHSSSQSRARNPRTMCPARSGLRSAPGCSPRSAAVAVYLRRLRRHPAGSAMCQCQGSIRRSVVSGVDQSDPRCPAGAVHRHPLAPAPMVASSRDLPDRHRQDQELPMVASNRDQRDRHRHPLAPAPMGVSNRDQRDRHRHHHHRAAAGVPTGASSRDQRDHPVRETTATRQAATPTGHDRPASDGGRSPPPPRTGTTGPPPLPRTSTDRDDHREKGCRGIGVLLNGGCQASFLRRRCVRL